MNNITLLGRLTKDPELKNANGTDICKFSLAVNRAYKKDEADFINCIAFNKTAQTISQFVYKGQQLCINGRLQINNYEGNDGVKRQSADVVVETFTFISNKENQASNNSASIKAILKPIKDEEAPF